MDTCSVGGIEGVCVSVSSGCCTGTTTAGLCPGDNDIKCCTENTCSTPYGNGVCEQTSACSGTTYSGYCTGPTDLQCCVDGGPPVTGVFGVDISAAASSSTQSCFQSSGYGDFTVPRGYRSTGAVDTTVCSNLETAQSVGIPSRDVYMFPCPTCSSASSQLNELVSYLNANCPSAFSGRVWLDIEGAQYWFSSVSSNQDFFQALVDSCDASGVSCGVYSSASQWEAIFGSSSYSYGSSLPLWYAHYDNNPSFSDFSAFGGWTAPFAKQYMGDYNLCGFDVDLDYAPSWSG